MLKFYEITPFYVAVRCVVLLFSLRWLIWYTIQFRLPTNGFRNATNKWLGKKRLRTKVLLYNQMKFCNWSMVNWFSIAKTSQWTDSWAKWMLIDQHNNTVKCNGDESIQSHRMLQFILKSLNPNEIDLQKIQLPEVK